MRRRRSPGRSANVPRLGSGDQGDAAVATKVGGNECKQTTSGTAVGGSVLVFLLGAGCEGGCCAARGVHATTSVTFVLQTAARGCLRLWPMCTGKGTRVPRKTDAVAVSVLYLVLDARDGAWTPPAAHLS